MPEPTLFLELGATGLAALAITLATLLRGWRQWLALQAETAVEPRDGQRRGRGRSEIAELRARVRKLEAIACGIEL